MPASKSLPLCICRDASVFSTGQIDAKANQVNIMSAHGQDKAFAYLGLVKGMNPGTAQV